MQVTYDRQLKIAGLGMVPWTRLGLEQWFDNYRIISYADWDCQGMPGAPPVSVYPGTESPLQNLKVNSLVQTNWYKQLLDGFTGYKLLPYKPIPPQLLTPGHDYLMTDARFTTTFENKAEFRLMFGDALPFPEYRIVDCDVLDGMNWEDVRGDRAAVVLQHEQLGGGRGTHIVRDAAGLKAAVAALPAGSIVISTFINGKERSVQGCVTRHGTFFSAPQRQIIGDPLLTKLDMPQPNLFCGAELGTAELAAGQQTVLDGVMSTIGDKLREAGFKGTFGVDLLIAGGELYVLEVNARLTMVTPLHTMFYGSASNVPFYLLHTLELANADYTLKDESAPGSGVGSMMLIHHLADSAELVTQNLASGLYSYKDGQLQLVRRDFTYHPGDLGSGHVLVQAYAPKGTIAKPGSTLAVVFLDQPVLGENDVLNQIAQGIVAAVRAGVELTEVGKHKN